MRILDRRLGLLVRRRRLDAVDHDRLDGNFLFDLQSKTEFFLHLRIHILDHVLTRGTATARIWMDVRSRWRIDFYRVFISSRQPGLVDDGTSQPDSKGSREL